MILERISVPRLQQVEVSLSRLSRIWRLTYQDLDDTTRGAGGFGSTGGFGPASKKQKTEEQSEVASEEKKE
jgi:dUTP pyrophosphatase